MELQHKNFPVHEFKAVDEAQGIVECYVAVFGNVDYAGDRILPGAFAKSLQRKLPKGVWMHDWTLPVAKTLEAEEVLAGDRRLPAAIKDNGGLRIKAQFNLSTQRGKEAFSDLQFGTVDEFSIGYYTQEERRAKDGANELIELDLPEWSPVLLGCNPVTQLVSAKGAPALPETKGQYLGAYVEGSMTLAACECAGNALYWCVWDALFDSEGTREEKLARVDAALAEFHQLVLSTVSALYPADADASAAEALSAEMKSRWPRPDTADPPAGKAFDMQLDALLADAQRCQARGAQIAALRAKDGRTLSEARRQKIVQLRDALTALAEPLRPAALALETAEALLEHYRQKQRRREPATT